MKLFPDDESYELIYKAMRDEADVTCKHCVGKDHYWQQSI